MTQAMQEAQQAQEVLTLEQVAAQLDAAKLYTLKVEAQAAIDAQQAPAEILQTLIDTLFGPHSQEAKDVAAIIETDKRPGGHELALATIWSEQKTLRQQARQLDQMKKAIETELATLDAAARAEMAEQAEDQTTNAALADILKFCRTADLRDNLAPQLETLYTRHKYSAQAMGLLFGYVTDLARKKYNAGLRDMIEQQQLADIAARIEAAAAGNA